MLGTLNRFGLGFRILAPCACRWQVVVGVVHAGLPTSPARNLDVHTQTLDLGPRTPNIKPLTHKLTLPSPDWPRLWLGGGVGHEGGGGRKGGRGEGGGDVLLCQKT